MAEIRPKARLEVCCSDPESILAARRGGAGRIELCSGLTEGGLTPSPALVRFARESGIPEINVLIRVRKGDFLYTDAEKRVMEEDIQMAVANGATGIVCGGLTADGRIDVPFLHRLRELSRGLNLTFHRAFDLCRDSWEALEILEESETDCLLTSGMRQTAENGIGLIAALVARSRKLKVMAGSGVTAANCRRIVDATGVGLVHATARAVVESGMCFRRRGVSMSAPGDEEYAVKTTSAEEVAKIIKAIS